MNTLSKFVIWTAIVIASFSVVYMFILFICCSRKSLRRHAYTQTDNQIYYEIPFVVVNPNHEIVLSNKEIQPTTINDSLNIV